MHGDVEEWCYDWYDTYETEQMLSDPVGAASGRRRVLRGGAHPFRPRDARAAIRVNSLFDLRPVTRNRFSGFRLARTYPLSP